MEESLELKLNEIKSALPPVLEKIDLLRRSL